MTFNVLDIVVIVILGLSVLAGLYRGFLVSVLNIAAFFLACVLAYVCHPMVAENIKQNQDIYPIMSTYAEGSEKINDVELARADIADVSFTQLNEIINRANLPIPVDTAIKNNIANESFEEEGVTRLGDYFNESIVNVAINIISFLIVFVVVRLALAVIIHGVNYAVKFPVLRQFDGILGAGFGFIRGFFMCFVVFAVVPLILLVISIEPITDLLDKSILASFFYKSNFLLGMIDGVI